MKNKSVFLLVMIALSGYSQSSAHADKPPYISPVPRFTFAKTLAEQEEQLRTNPLMLRFAGSRKRLASDRYRPLYHFVSPESNTNDPNGLCFWQGRWHLFYLVLPQEDRRWLRGHSVSDDLIHWCDLPYAIYPNPEKHVYSGSTLVEDNRVIFMYHGTEVGNMVAISDDPLLLNWEKVTGKAVIPLTSPTGFPLPYSVFDPCIWKKDGIYYSLSAGRAPKGPAGKQVATAYLFRSKDLANWEYLHEFVEGDRFTMINDDYAVPYFWPIGDRYILTFASHRCGGQYLLGDYDKKNDKFVVSNHDKFNFGTYNNYGGVNAPSATPDGKGGVIVIFNLMPGKPLGEWGQVMTLPRRLTLIGKDAIGQEPAGDIASLRYNRQEVKPMVLPANKEIVLKNIRGNAMEINLEIDAKSASMIELNVLRSSGKEEYTSIALFKEGGFGTGRDYKLGQLPPARGTVLPAAPGPVRSSLITIETSRSSLLPDVKQRAPETAQILMEPDETFKLRVFIDKSVVEVFVNGRQALSARVFPSRDDSQGVYLRAQGNECELKSLEAWQMKSIYE